MANTSLDYGNVTMCFGKAGLVAGTTTTVSIANNITYAIAGKMYSKTAASNIAAPTTDGVTGAAFKAIPVGSIGVFVIALDSGGNLKVIQGGIEALDGNYKTINAPQFPDIPAESASFQGGSTGPYCAIGYLTVLCGSGSSAWTFGSSNTSGATGVTYAFQDVAALPGRPQTA